MNHFTREKTQAETTYTLKHIFCNDPGCWSCAQGKGHGPYWHASYHDGDKTQTVFLGKEFSPLEIDPLEEKPDTASNEKPEKTRYDNMAENRFASKISRPFKPADTVGVQGVANPRKKNNRLENPTPPTQFDFERDLRSLTSTYQADRLKTLYRKLTKKYHPDRYPGIGHITAWMAEINGQYSQKKKSIRC